MKQLINNVVDMGFGGVLVWFMAVMIMHWLLNQGARGIESYLGIGRNSDISLRSE